jgi:hypothetical protein
VCAGYETPRSTFTAHELACIQVGCRVAGDLPPASLASRHSGIHGAHLGDDPMLAQASIPEAKTQGPTTAS